MNILLIRPRPHKDSIGLQSFMICEPLELEYVCSYLEKSGHNVEIIDMIIEKKSLEYFIKKFNPDIVGFTSYISHIGVVKNYAKEVKMVKNDCITIVGGIQAEVVPQDFEDDNIDYILKVNGLKTFKEIIENIENGFTKRKEEIDGVWTGANKTYKIDTEFKYPFPNREKTRKYRSKYNYIFHKECALLKTSFGCPYNCEFCFCVEIAQHKYFVRDLDEVIEELKGIQETNIFIVDDNFLFKKERVLEFCRLLDENNIKKNFILFGRADFITDNEDVIKRLSEVGLKSVFVGIESFKEEDLSNFNKRTNVEMNINAIRTLEKYDVECYSGIIVGMDWTSKDFDNLSKWLNSFKRPLVNIQPITPMPGTVIYNKLEQNISLPREKYEMWDMTHLAIKPTKMSTRKFYYNILKTYFKTGASVGSSIYILKRYGLETYLHNLKGALYITWQYIKMIIKG